MNENSLSSSASFRLDKIDDNVVSGRFSPSLAIPQYFRDSDEYLGYNDNNMSGEIIFGLAECEFSEFGKGNIQLEFINKDSIKVNIEYIEKDENHKNFGNGEFMYRPYNINDYLLFVENKSLEIETELDSWGNVLIISGQQESSHAVPVIYMTDEYGNIFYEFGAPYQHDTSVKEVVITDLNNDGLQDVKITTSISNDSPPEYDFIWNFYQLENGWFYMERAGYIP